MSFKIHPAFATIIVAGFIILLFMLFRGCNNSHRAIALNKELKEKNDSLNAKIIKDSIEALENKREYDIRLEIANGQVEIKDNQIARTGNELDAANKRINILLAKHKDVKPDSDTSVTLVPNEYIEECSECFNELQNGQQLVIKYRSDIDQLKISYLNKDRIKTDRINQQEKEKANLSKSLQDCIEISKVAQNASKPKGALYFSWNVLWAPLPDAASIGFIYQNKRKMMYGARWGYGIHGQFIETEMNLPLSLKRK